MSLGIKVDESDGQRLHHRLWMAGDHGEISSRGAMGTAASLLPIVQGAWGKSKGKDLRGGGD